MGDELFELHDVGREEADAFGGLFGGHGVFVEGEAEGGFVERHLFEIGFGGRGGVELARERGGGGLELGEESGGDGEEVAAGELGDLFMASAKVE